LIKKQWGATIHNRLPSIRHSYDEEVSKALNAFLNAVAIDVISICPEFGEALSQWKEIALRSLEDIEKHSTVVFDETMQDTARSAHRLATPQIQEIWSPIYEQCAVDFGRFPTFEKVPSDCPI